MRIATVAPLSEPVPPSRYGGTERVVSVRTEKLVRRGHQVALLASSGSRTTALTTVEAMATGTSVTATRHGSLPEVLADGVTGYLCEPLDEMVEAVARVGEIECAACRTRVERYCSGAAMTDRYLRVHELLLDEVGGRRGALSGTRSSMRDLAPTPEGAA